jgi:hypothetical protein
MEKHSVPHEASKNRGRVKERVTRSRREFQLFKLENNTGKRSRLGEKLQKVKCVRRSRTVVAAAVARTRASVRGMRPTSRREDHEKALGRLVRGREREREKEREREREGDEPATRR